MEIAPGTDLGWSREQESCLKQQLLKIAVQEEIQQFMENPDSVNNLLFLSFFRTKIMAFPLLNSREHARSKMDELLKRLPEFLTLSQRATKHDTQNRKMRVIVVANLNGMLRTPKERAYDLRRTLEDYNTEQDMVETADLTEKTRQARSLAMAKELARVSLSIFLDLEKEGGVQKFFTIVKENKNLADVPPMYQSFFKYMGKAMAVEMERTYSDPKHVNGLKKLYRLTPVHAIRGILAMTDPTKLLEGLLAVFLARPFHTHNLMQKMAAAGTQLKASKAQLQEAKTNMMRHVKRLDAKKINHIYTLMNTHANTVPLPIVEEEDFVGRPVGKEIVDYDKLVPIQMVKDILHTDKSLSDSEIEGLTHEETASIRDVLVLEMRVKDKSDFVELLGTQDTIDMAREIIPIFFEVISTIKKADFGHYLGKYFKAMKEIVKVSEASKDKEVEDRINAFEVMIEKMQDDLYSFIHAVFINDNGEIQKTFEWYIGMVQFVHRREAVDVQKLLVPLSVEQRMELQEEVDRVLEYYKTATETGAPPASRPVSVKIRSILDPFLAMMRARLSMTTDMKSVEELVPPNSPHIARHAHPVVNGRK